MKQLRSLVDRARSSNFARMIVETYLTRVALIVIGVGATMVIARILGPEGRGQFAVANAVGALGARFGNLGLHASNTYFVAKDASRLPVLIGNSLVLSFVVIGAITAISGVVFFAFPALAPLRGTMLVLALAWIPIALACFLAQNLLIGVQEVRAYNRIDLSSRVFGLVLIGVVIALGALSPEFVTLAGISTMVLTVAWALIVLRPHCRRPISVSWPMFRDGFFYSSSAYLAGMLDSLLVRGDVLIIQYVKGAEATGHYSVAVSIADLIYMLPIAVNAVLFPRLSATPDPTEQWRLMLRTAQTLAVCLLPIALLAVGLARPAIETVFGAAFLPAVAAFVWLVPGIVFLSIGSVMQNYIGSTGYARGMVVAPLVAACTNVIANLCLIGSYGIVGVAWASTGSYALMAIVAWWVARSARQLAVEQYAAQIRGENQSASSPRATPET